MMNVFAVQFNQIHCLQIVIQDEVIAFVSYGNYISVNFILADGGSQIILLYNVLCPMFLHEEIPRPLGRNIRL